MTTPIIPEGFDARAFLAFLRSKGLTNEAGEFETLLREQGLEYVIRNVERQEEYQGGLLGGRMARLNENDRDMAQALTPSYGAQVAGGISALGADIPGVEALQAGGRVLLRNQSYPEALEDIRGARESNPASTFNAIAGSIPAAAVMPGGPVAQGAAYGGLLNLLSADADELEQISSDPVRGMGARLKQTAGGALTGAAFGKVGDVAEVGLRALRAPGVERGLGELVEQRATATRPLYEQADVEGMLAQGARGRSGVATPELRRVLNQPDVADLVTQLQGQRQFAGLAPDDPRMLDALYKALSDAERAAAKPGMALDPTRINTGRFNVENIRAAKQELLEAMSRNPNAPMPTYAGAVDEYAAQSALLEAFTRGNRAMGVSVGSRANPKTIAKTGPQSLLDFLESASPEAADAAAEGAESYIQNRVGQAGVTGLVNPMRTTARGGLLEGGELLRKIDQFRPASTQRSLLELLRTGATTAPVPEFGRP